ncbi:hypothetical protein [Herbaspirillum huttiense]|uniref:hypothetical protein n=1 Tax=Herbaspirillum huttiense TaxID=863372 RepID=UPI0039B0B729
MNKDQFHLESCRLASDITAHSWAPKPPLDSGDQKKLQTLGDKVGALAAALRNTTPSTVDPAKIDNAAISNAAARAVLASMLPAGNPNMVKDDVWSAINRASTDLAAVLP